MELIWWPVLAGIAIVGVRVIGVRLGWVRAVLIAWLGLATAGILLGTLTGEDGEGPPSVLVVAIGLFAMIA